MGDHEAIQDYLVKLDDNLHVSLLGRMKTCRGRQRQLSVLARS